jgi:two-component system cell cycle sensor histidine kinase PleC
MVMNLLSNAVKFTPAGGQITISCDVRKNGSCRLNIKDTGVGMAADQVEKAISPFGQLDTKLSRANSGTGLGLTLVNSLIKLHGGSLDIKSKENKGTTASLIFPSKRVALNKTSGDENSSESDKKKTNVVKFNDTK